MKIRGKKISDKNLEICVIPRGNGEDIVFKCQAVLDMDDFDKLCPEPKPPTELLPGGIKKQDIEDPFYKGMLELRNTKRIAYIVLKSLEATEDLEWETIKLSDSSTWANYESELKESGFSAIEVMRIVNSCMTANCLSESRLEQARNDFLAGVVKDRELLSSRNGELKNMPSGKPVNA